MQGMKEHTHLQIESYVADDERQRSGRIGEKQYKGERRDTKGPLWPLLISRKSTWTSL